MPGPWFQDSLAFTEIEAALMLPATRKKIYDRETILAARIETYCSLMKSHNEAHENASD